MRTGPFLRLVIGMGGLLALFGFGTALFKEDGELRRVGVPEGAAGLLASYVLQEKMAAGSAKAVHYEQHTLYDCCAAASQYALGSGDLDLAIMCPDAGRTLVEKDARFEIVGPVLVNADIFVIRPGGEEPSAVGISQKREYQRQMVAERFGDRCEAIPMLHAAVPFAFAKHEVDAVVADITRAFSLAGDFHPGGVNGRDLVTAVLVVKKTIKTDEQYRQFLREYEDAVREMAEPERLLHLLTTYASKHISIGDVKLWKRMQVRFVSPSASLPSE